jgi:hypothetical protein
MRRGVATVVEPIEQTSSSFEIEAQVQHNLLVSSIYIY